MVETASLEVWDIVIITLYFVIIMAVGIGATARASRGSARGFFLAEKSMTFLPIAGSIFATNMGAPMFVGLAGSAAATGFAPVMFEWHSTYMLILLGWIFVPIYVASGTFTMPDYLQKRYGGKRLRVYFAITSLVLIILSGISAEMYAGSLFIQQLLGWNTYASCGVILAITAVYTIGGGLAAVIYTDTVQTVILVIGSLSVAIIGMSEVGGYEAMLKQYQDAATNTTYLNEALYGNQSCGFPPDDAFHIFRAVDSDYPWPGLIFGLTILAMHYFCTNQVIVQRNLAAKDVSHSKAACVITSYLKLLPFFLFVWPGMISRILYPQEVACTDPELCEDICDNPAGCTNIAYPLLVLRILPTGLRGLMLAGLLAALMSSLTSNFNSASSMFTIDLWKLCRPHASEKEVVLVGRLFGLFMVGLSFAWLPILTVIQGGYLWDYLQAISSYVTPPWVVVFVLGVFWKRCTEQGAFWGLMAGLVVGVCRMGIHFAYPTPSCGGGEPDTRPAVFTKVHYLHFAMILAGIVLIVTVLISLVTKPRQQKQLHRVTWWSRKDRDFPDLTDNEDSDEESDEAIIKARAEQEDEQDSCGQKAQVWFCGDTREVKMTKAEKQQQLINMTSITENKFWSQICDINAVIAIALTSFIIGFYY